MKSFPPATPISRSFLLDPLWSMLPRMLAITMPRTLLLAEIGDDALKWLERSGCAYGAAFEPDQPYPCRKGMACSMVVTQDTRRAVCSRLTPECLPIPIKPGDVQVHISAQALVHVVQQSLGLASRWKDDGKKVSVIRLGRRQLGDRTVDCVLLLDPEDEMVLDWLDHLSRDHPERALAVIVVRREDLPASTPPDNQIWMALADGQPTDGGLLLDHVPLWDRFAPGVDPGENAGSPFQWVADPRNRWYRYADRVIHLDTHPLHSKLLASLLVERGSWQSRRVLVAKVFGNEQLREYELVSRWEQLRGVKREVAAIIAGLGLPKTLSNPILMTKADGGGYQIAKGGAIRWLSK